MGVKSEECVSGRKASWVKTLRTIRARMGSLISSTAEGSIERLVGFTLVVS